LPWRCGRVCLVEFLIGEPDVAELDAAEPSPAAGEAGETIVGSVSRQLEHALAGSHCRLQDVVFVAEVLDGTEEALRVLDEGDSTPRVTVPKMEWRAPSA